METKPEGRAGRDNDTAQGFVGSVFKFSISTVATIITLGISMLVTGIFIPKGINGQIDLFTGYTNTIMTIAILGLDQSLIRFYYEPPAGVGRKGLFRVCFYFSALALLVGGTLCSTLLAGAVYEGIGFTMVGREIVPMLFLNAFFFMVIRYFIVLYRMEMSIKTYTVITILMQFFYKLFYLVGYILPGDNPVMAMAICSLAGFAGFALVFGFLRRETLRPRLAEFKSGAYKTVLPYGLAVAPTAVFVTLGAQLPKSIIVRQLGEELQGVYSFTYQLSNIVALIQGGFAAFWGAYMFENYRTQRQRIMKVHDFLNFIILVFFAVLVAFEDILFWIFRQYTDTQAQAIFPLMMLSAVFTILCEGTVYGNAIGRRPIYDTIGIGLSLATNLLAVAMLVPRFGTERGLYGAALAVALANGVMFLFRTITAQRLYRTIRYPLKTAAAIAIAIALTAAGTVLHANFVGKGLCALAAIGVYCLMYRAELLRCIKMGIEILGYLFKRGAV